jgi:hypothetical protein
MATEIVTTMRLRDDRDGTLIESGYKVQFAYEGQDYVLDLSPENREEYDADMREWVQHARKVGKVRKSDTAKPVGTEVDVTLAPPDMETKATARELLPPAVRDLPQSALNRRKRPGIKRFALDNGFPVPEFGGRMTEEVERLYDEKFGVAS